MAVLNPPPKPRYCPLAGYSHPCKGRLTVEHIVSKQKARGSKKVRGQIDQPELLQWTCLAHNVSHTADNPECRAILLERNVRHFGEGRVRKVLDGLDWKVPRPELRFDVVMENLPAQVRS